MTHRHFVAALREIADPAAVSNTARFFHADPNARSKGNKVLGVHIGDVFPVAKRFAALGKRSLGFVPSW